MRKLLALISVLSFNFLLSSSVYAGDSPCMVSGLASGFSTFILPYIYTIVLVLTTLFIIVKINKKYSINFSIIKIILLITVITFFSLVPFDESLLMSSYNLTHIFSLKVLAYSLLILFIVRKTNIDMNKVKIITLVLFVLVDFAFANLIFHTFKEPLLTIYKNSFGDYAKFYTVYKDECGNNYTFE